MRDDRSGRNRSTIKLGDDQTDRSGRSGSSGSKKMDISPAQVAGGALAAVTAAVLGGQLGVAGTVGGAALTSVVITVGGAVYQRSLETTRSRANVASAKAALKRAKRRPLGQPVAGAQPPEKTTRRIDHGSSGAASPGMYWPGGERVVEGGLPDDERTRRINDEGRTRRLRWDGTQYVPAASARPGREGPAGSSTNAAVPEQRASQRRRRIRWSAVAVTSGLAFLLCMLVVTGFEGITGRPLSGGEQGTTVGHMFREGVPKDGPVQPAPEPSDAPANPGSDDERPAGTGPADTSPKEPTSPAQPSDAPVPEKQEPGQQVPDEQAPGGQEPAPETGTEAPRQPEPEPSVQQPAPQEPQQEPQQTAPQ